MKSASATGIFSANFIHTTITKYSRRSFSSRLILCGGPVALAGVTYLVCAVVFKSITREDCLLLPKGNKIAKLLRL